MGRNFFKQYLAKVAASFLVAFLLSHVLVTNVFQADAPVVRQSFVDRVNSARRQISLFYYQSKYNLKQLPKKLALKPPGETKLPDPWYFVPPPDWVLPTSAVSHPSRPTNVPLPDSPRETPYIRPPTATPMPFLPGPTRAGGGFPAPTTAVNQPPTPTVAVFLPTATPVLLPTPTNAPGSAPSQAAQQLLDLINGERQRQGMGTLRFDDRLNRAAQSYADVIGPAGVCSHTYGSTVMQRFQQVGYPTISGGENITCGIGSPQGAFNAWMNSPGHRANMLEPSWKSAGLGFNGANGGYWVLDLGPV